MPKYFRHSAVNIIYVTIQSQQIPVFKSPLEHINNLIDCYNINVSKVHIAGAKYTLIEQSGSYANSHTSCQEAVKFIAMKCM